MTTAPTYNELLQTPQWREKRQIILTRDGNKCRCCGKTELLQVHHRQYHINQQTREFILPWNYNNKHLVTLCDGCHKAGHRKFKVPTFTI